MSQRDSAKATVSTPSEREIRIERIFDAPRERVWRAMTDPELVAKWWGRGNRLVIERMEVQRGGHWRFVEHSPDGVHGFEGRYREVIPPERVVQTFEWDGMPGHVVVETMILEDLGDGRTKVVNISLFHTTEDRDGMLKSGMEQGLNQSYRALDRVLQAMGRGNKVTPFLMFDGGLEQALELYTSIFPDSRVKNVSRSGKDGPMTAAEFIVGGQSFMAFNGGPHFSFSEGFSMYVDCADQAEVDLYWDKLLAAGAKPTQCGWIRDPFGLSWQIIPRRFSELLKSGDPKKVQAVIGAMMKMVKLDVAELERAYEQG